MWDYDLPTAPNLITVERGGQRVDAVAQPTKMGFIYVLDRVTGEPLFPVEERAVPPSNIPGEEAWPTQPFPSKPETFSRQTISEPEVIGYADDESYDSNLKYVNDLWFKGLFTPLDLKTTVMYPGSRGGAEWGGGAYDPETGILYINSNDMPELGRLAKTRVAEDSGETLYNAGEILYKVHCASCHGSDRQGSGINAFIGQSAATLNQG